MINLAGDNNADNIILEELYLAGIKAVKSDKCSGEVPYTYIGVVGNWEFRRYWSYWVATVDYIELGLPLKLALELHNKKHPIDNSILGEIIRSGGHGCGLSPDEYGANPICNDDLDNKLLALGYEKKYYDFLKKEYVDITVGEISKLCNEGKLDVERYVNAYHIDTQIGLNEFVLFIKKQ